MYWAVALAPDSVKSSAQPNTTADTQQPAPVFIRTGASCKVRLEIRTSL